MLGFGALSSTPLSDLGAVANTLTPATGSYILTGNAVILRRDVRITASNGSYTLTGQAVTLRRDVKITATSGSYALTGQAVALTSNGKTLVATSGSYALTGNSVNLIRARTIAATSGSYALTGQAAILRLGRKLLPASGSYALTGNAALLAHGYRLTPSAGSYALTGNITRLFYNQSESFTVGFIVQLLPPDTAISVEYDAQLTVDGRDIKIKEFEYREDDHSVSGLLNVVLANVDDRQYILDNSAVTFQMGAPDSLQTLVDTGAVGTTDYRISRQGFLPNDQFTIQAKPPELVKLQISFANGGVVYDPRKIEINESDWPFIYSTDGSILRPEFVPVYGLTWHQVATAGLTNVAGLAWATNIPDFPVTIAEFHPGDPVVNTVNGLIGGFEPDYQMDAGTGVLFIRNGTSGSPSGLPGPRTLTVSNATQISVSLDQSVRYDGVLLTYMADTRQFDSSSTRTEDSTSASGTGANYTKTIVTKTYKDFFRNSSEVPVLTQLLSVQTDVYHTIKEYVSIGGAIEVGLSLELSESSLETFSYNDKGLPIDRLKTASKLLPLPDGDTVPTRDNQSPAKTASTFSSVLVDALYEHETINYKVHPFKPLHLYISDREIHTEGILYADVDNPQLDNPYGEAADKVLRAGNVTTSSVPFWGGIESYIETGTPIKGGQVRYHILEVDQAAGVVTQNRDEWRDGELGSIAMIHETRQVIVGTHSSGVLKPIHAGEAPLSIGLPLAERVLRQANVLTSKVSFTIPYIDLTYTKGAEINALGRDGEDLGNYIIEGRAITGERGKYGMTLVCRQAS